MKNLFAYMDTLSEAINLLQLPFKFSTSYMLFGSFLTQVEFHKSKYASEKNALFDNINNYTSNPQLSSSASFLRLNVLSSLN